MCRILPDTSGKISESGCQGCLTIWNHVISRDRPLLSHTPIDTGRFLQILPESA